MLLHFDSPPCFTSAMMATLSEGIVSQAHEAPIVTSTATPAFDALDPSGTNAEMCAHARARARERERERSRRRAQALPCSAQQLRS
mmetsp:Transcript_138407/g.240866  ORF Transcript_138407/g.240866 Transcript_138407/m.240866 type:complete len:86 (+) Transcript_138407:1094-1351(+)